VGQRTLKEIVLVFVLTEGVSLVPMTAMPANNVNLLLFLLLGLVLVPQKNISLLLMIHAKIVIRFVSHALALRKMNVRNVIHHKTVRSIRQQRRVTASYLFMRRTMNQHA
jgi:hypothetical protein